MNNLNQNKTDNFFRQALNTAPSLSPSEGDWEKMEHLLKSGKKRKSAIVWFYWTAGIAAGLLVFFSLWFSGEPSKQLVQNQKKENKKPDQVTIEDKNESVNPNTETILSNNSVRSKSSEMNPSFSEPNSNLIPAENAEIENSGIKRQEKPEPLSLIDYAINQDFRTVHKLDPGKAPLIPTETLLAEKHTDTDHTVAQAQKNPGIKKDGKLVLSLAVTGDLNSVNTIGNSKTGLSYGLGLSYKVLKGLSIGTGIYYSQKKYTSDKYSYYTTEKPFVNWVNYSKQIDADCKVIDIPLNLNLQLIKTEKTGIIASAGLSSYLMLSEKYNFIYNYNPNSPYSGRQYTIKNENKHIMGIVNLAIGIEKPLGKQNSIVILPYAKLPIEGIGQGQTELKSFGLGFQLNYSMKKKEKFFNRKSE